MDSPVSTDHKLLLRNLRMSDYADVKEVMDAAYRGVGGAWSQQQFNAQVSRFPEGQICIEDNGKVVAAALTIIIDYTQYGDAHTYEDIVGKGHFGNHDTKGDYLYGVDVFVHPGYRGMRLGRRLYDARKELCENLNLRGILIGGRIPGYKKHPELTPRQYIEMVKNKEIFDPVLTFQLSNDFHIKRLVKNYWPEDQDSDGNAVLLEWNNIYYEEKAKLIGGKKEVVRLGVVQWQMRRFPSFDDFVQQAEFFVDTVSGYNADLVLFPEFFNAPLMAQYNQEDPAEAMRSLADHTEPLRKAFVDMAVAYNTNIVAGSVPEYRDRKLYNVSYLCRRDGTWDCQYKLHVTPDEFSYWGVQGGDALKVFDTDIGRIGILICFDVEFPELARFMVDQGMVLLLVPYYTDTKNGYLRVRRCAQARAIENECYVAISGSVGSLPKIENMDIQYSQAAVFTPSDFSFPHDAVAAEATPNTEMTLLADLDLDLLKEMRQHGSVCNVKNRRLDLYNLNWLASHS